MVIFPDVQVLDAAGPLEVFSLANCLARGPRYEVSVLAPEAGPVMTSSGLPIVAGRSIRQASGPVDTLIVAGGLGSGAFLLGEAGLLDGRRATTHWAVCDALQRRYPGARVEGDPIFVRDGKISTSAGVTAGMDLALELVEEDGGRDLALSVARWLVMFLRRPGGQSQFSVQLRSQVAERRGLRDLQSWIADHLGEDLSVPALARRTRMSPRNFARAFRREIGLTPAAYVEAQRVESARRLLETADLSVAEVAAACGFGRVETMHRAFRRGVRVSPAQYRRHFRAAS
jgi:transcriptional regulator GlxA family with amidase domain